MLAMPGGHSQKRRQTVWRASGRLSSGHGAWAQRGLGRSAHPPFRPGAAVQGQQANLRLLAPPLEGGAGGLGDVLRASPLVKRFCELALSREGPERAFRMPKRKPLLGGPRLGGCGGHVP